MTDMFPNPEIFKNTLIFNSIKRLYEDKIVLYTTC